MRSGKPSRTAQMVAYCRALSTLASQVPGFSDPLAAEFLPEKWRKRVEKSRQAMAASPGKSPYPFWVRSGQCLINEFRTLVLDRAIVSAELSPQRVPQLVILGAGFDSRAWRLDALQHSTVFEVDHPATQALKRERACAWPAKAQQVRFVAMDFRHDDLAAVLRAAGHDSKQPTFWLWEGVTLYLRPAEVAANLTAFAALSAPGSRLALTYLSKDRGKMPRSVLLALMGEPLRSAYSPTEMSVAARSCGWTAMADSGIEDWLRDLTSGLRATKRQVGLQWFERILIAVKSSPA
jgi:methyltransferase (TIGR00027 family)